MSAAARDAEAGMPDNTTSTNSNLERVILFNSPITYQETTFSVITEKVGLPTIDSEADEAVNRGDFKLTARLVAPTTHPENSKSCSETKEAKDSNDVEKLCSHNNAEHPGSTDCTVNAQIQDLSNGVESTMLIPQGFILIGGNTDSDKLSDCEVYSDDHVSIPSIPLTLSGHIAAKVEATEAIIVAGGRHERVSDRTFILSTITSSNWVEVGQMVEAVEAASSVSYKQFVLVLGGRKGDNCNTDIIQCMDMSQATQSWTRLEKKLPSTMSSHQSVIFKDNLVIVTDEGNIHRCPVSQIVGDAGEVDWIHDKLPGVEGDVYGPGLGVVNDSLVVVFGRDVLTKSSVGSDSEWSPLPQLPQRKTCWPSIGTRNSQLVVAGGYEWDGWTVYMLNTDLNNWDAVTPLKLVRYNHATVQLLAPRKPQVVKGNFGVITKSTGLAKLSTVDSKADEALERGDFKLAGSLLAKGSSLTKENKNYEPILQLMQYIQDSNEDSAIKMLSMKPPTEDLLNISVDSPPLHFAASKNLKKVVGKLLLCGADLHLKNSDGNTALHLAVSKNLENIVGKLLSNGADPQIQNNAGNTPFNIANPQLQNTNGDSAADMAVRFNKYNLAASLIEKGSSLNKENKNYEPILQLMQYIQDNNEDSAIELLSSNPPTKVQLNVSVSKPPLYFALSKNLETVVEKLLLCGADPQLHNSDGNTALQLAESNKMEKVLEKLLLFVADPQLQNSNGDTEADIAVKFDKYTLAATLIAKGSSLKKEHKNYEPILQLMQYIQDREEDSAITMLSNKPPSKDQLNISVSKPPLHFAISKDLVKVAEKLMKCGADPQLKNSCGDTALHLVIKGGRMKPSLLKLVEKSMECRFDPQLQNSDGNTALHLAASLFNPGNVVAILLEYQANPKTQNSFGDTALHSAIRGCGNTELLDVVEKLLMSGAEPNLQNRDGNTALHLLAGEMSEKYEENIVEILLANGADPQIQNNIGYTVEEVAMQYSSFKQAEIIDKLKKKIQIYSTHQACPQSELTLTKKHKNISEGSGLGDNSGDVVDTMAELAGHQVCPQSEQTSTTQNKQISDSESSGLGEPKIPPMLHVIKECGDNSDNFGRADLAVSEHYYKIAAKLLEKGGRLNEEENKKYEPILLLMQSIEDCDEDSAISILSETKVGLATKLNIKVLWPPLHLAAHQGLDKVVRKLLECGAEIDHEDTLGYIALEWAVRGNHPGVVELLTSQENVNKVCKMDETLLGHAAIYGYEQVMTKLISKSADTSKVPSDVKIPSSVMLKCLDGSISFAQEDKVKDSRHPTKKEDRQLLFDYQLVLGKDETYVKSSTSETEKVETFCNKSQMHDILPHPLIKTIIFQKWKKIEWAYWVWICLKLLLFLSVLITAIQMEPDTPNLKNQKQTYSNFTDEFGPIKKRNTTTIPTSLKTQTEENSKTTSTEDHKTKADPILLNEFNRILFPAFLFVFGIAELFQIGYALYCIVKTCFQKTSKRTPAYITDVKNIIQLAILSCIAIILFDYNSSLCQITHRYILGALLPLSCFELLYEIGHIPGCAHIIQIFNMVLLTFLKYLAFYGLLIISFAASFSVILSKTSDNYPANFGMLFAKHIVMSTGEQEFMNVPFSDGQNWYEVVFFITFTILIVVVMMAVLNALAIVDIQKMMQDVEVPMLEELLDKVLLWDNLLTSLGNNHMRLFTNKDKIITFHPFKKNSTPGYSGIFRKGFVNLFLKTYVVIYDECIFGSNGALQVLSIKEEEEVEKRRKNDEMKDQRRKHEEMQQTNDEMKQTNDEMKDQIKQMKDEMKEMKDQMKDQIKQMNNQMTFMCNLLMTKHENAVNNPPEQSYGGELVDPNMMGAHGNKGTIYVMRGTELESLVESGNQ